jgi:hypothetical protein
MNLISRNPFPVVSDQLEGQPQVEDDPEADGEEDVDVPVDQKIGLNHFDSTVRNNQFTKFSFE